ncbi:MAG TPA: DUF3395 domain-containing protein [Candidatus Acidoferrum sp.]|nr:DUF3395 domain-containing protein [Candidatus Acidoferrum sp.]
MKRIITGLAILLTVAFSSFAQSRRWELLRAEYGSGGSWVDVTERVRALVNGDSLNMRVDNDTLGGDPTPGVRKTLRLRVRDEYRREQLLTYPEKESFSLSIRSGRPPMGVMGGGGAMRGGLQILRADYGIDNRLANVTSRLASAIQGDSLTLRVTNETMGGDPAEDHPKTLSVWYTYNGRVANVVVNEKDTLNLPADSDFFSGHLRVMRAQYGIGQRYADVTDLLNSQIQADQLSLRVTNDVMGGDPDPEQRKQLIVFYIFNGRQSRVTVNEKDYLNLPGNDAWNPRDYDARLEILEASYGAGDRRRDVTNLVSAQVRGNSLQLVVSNAAMGGDPAENQKKRLRVIYLWQGFRNQTTVGEGETLVIP